MNTLIAKCDCLITKLTGESINFSLGVSQPVQQKTGEYGCNTFLPDAELPRMIFGEGLLQSLFLALKIMADRINDLLSKQWKFEYSQEDERCRIPFEVYFMHPEWISALEEIGRQAEPSLQNKLK